MEETVDIMSHLNHPYITVIISYHTDSQSRTIPLHVPQTYTYMYMYIHTTYSNNYIHVQCTFIHMSHIMTGSSSWNNFPCVIGESDIYVSDDAFCPVYKLYTCIWDPHGQSGTWNRNRPCLFHSPSMCVHSTTCKLQLSFVHYILRGELSGSSLVDLDGHVYACLFMAHTLSIHLHVIIQYTCT